jgi:hypothetical protein
MNGNVFGTESKTFSGSPKFLARIDLGVCAIQSSTLKVVLPRKESRSADVLTWTRVIEGPDQTSEWHGLPLRIKVTIVKCKQELILIVEPLNGVADTLGKVPNIANSQFSKLKLAVLVDSRDHEPASVDEPPLSNTMPVKFANRALGEVLLRPRDVAAGGQI